MVIKDWNIEEMTGYKPKTTFYRDFSIADNFGVSTIRDTYKRAFAEWKDNVVYLTELVMVLDWKIWEHFKTNDMYAETYQYLWKQADEWAVTHLNDKDLSYFISTTD